MKVLFLLLFSINILANPNISEIRKLYPTAANSEIQATTFALKLSGITEKSDNTLVAYKGAALTLESKYTKNLSAKMSSFKEGAKLVDLAISKEPNNIEVRLIRLSIQENVPLVVKYRNNKSEDKAFLLKHYNEQSGALREYLKNFLLQSKSLTDAEKKSIQP